MIVIAILWNIVFLLGLRSTISSAKAKGFSNLRFITDSTFTAYFLIGFGVLLTCGSIVLTWNMLQTGIALELCRLCTERVEISFASNPISYTITTAAYVELTICMVFVTLLAVNSLRAITRK